MTAKSCLPFLRCLSYWPRQVRLVRNLAVGFSPTQTFLRSNFDHDYFFGLPLTRERDAPSSARCFAARHVRTKLSRVRTEPRSFVPSLSTKVCSCREGPALLCNQAPTVARNGLGGNKWRSTRRRPRARNYSVCPFKGVIIAGNRRFCQIGRSCVILLHPYGPHTDQVSGKMESPNDGWVARC